MRISKKKYGSGSDAYQQYRSDLAKCIIDPDPTFVKNKCISVIKPLSEVIPDIRINPDIGLFSQVFVRKA